MLLKHAFNVSYLFHWSYHNLTDDFRMHSLKKGDGFTWSRALSSWAVWAAQRSCLQSKWHDTSQRSEFTLRQRSSHINAQVWYMAPQDGFVSVTRDSDKGSVEMDRTAVYELRTSLSLSQSMLTWWPSGSAVKDVSQHMYTSECHAQFPRQHLQSLISHEFS